ncbi:MAG: hypothetical protein IJE08_10555 [Clostridia bacterium]|nr:hypothetical protein [Clostridia bacterium]
MPGPMAYRAAETDTPDKDRSAASALEGSGRNSGHREAGTPGSKTIRPTKTGRPDLRDSESAHT